VREVPPPRHIVLSRTEPAPDLIRGALLKRAQKQELSCAGGANGEAGPEGGGAGCLGKEVTDDAPQRIIPNGCERLHSRRPGFSSRLPVGELARV
jgi:hypothetical protein